MKVALLAAAVAAAFVLLRTTRAAEGDPSRFVLAGDLFVDRTLAPAGLHVFADSSGFDGQFQWRLAAAPTVLSPERHLGAVIDDPVRLQRVGYPYLAWAVSAGGVDRVPVAMIVVNILGLGALAGGGALLARDGGRSVWWGLLLAGVPGLVTVLSRDLTEIVAAAMLVLGVAAANRDRWWLTAAAWSWGVLTREQLAIAVAAFGVWRIARLVRRRGRWGAADAAWALPGATFVAWQLIVLQAAGALPVRSGTGANLGLPLAGVVESLPSWTRDALGGAGVPALWVGLFCVLAVLVGAALLTRLPAEVEWQRWIVAVLALLAISLTPAVLLQPAELRTVSDLWVMSWVVVFRSQHRRLLWLLAAGQVLGMTATMAFRTMVV